MYVLQILMQILMYTHEEIYILFFVPLYVLSSCARETAFLGDQCAGAAWSMEVYNWMSQFFSLKLNSREKMDELQKVARFGKNSLDLSSKYKRTGHCKYFEIHQALP